MSGAKKQNLEDQEWYHGYRPKRVVMKLLKEPGDWLVRATDSGPNTDIVLSIISNQEKVSNLTLKCEDKKWYLGTICKDPIQKARLQRFETVCELIEHYKVKSFSRKFTLKNAIARPQWMLKHDKVSYKPEDKLGSGNFSVVFKGQLTQADSVKEVAVKISLNSVAANEVETEKAKTARSEMLREAQIMSYYVHENVIQFFGVACDHQPILVLMEFCPGGDLQTHLQKQGAKIETAERVLYCLESSRGMKYLHDRKCVHRDLAARNCLISSKGVVKISDFGLSQLLEEQKDEKEDGDEAKKDDMSNAQVPLRWMAPECLKKTKVFSMMSDVWAYGVMVYEIFNNGEKPWPGADVPPKYIATQIRRGNMPAVPEATPKRIKEVVRKMWSLIPEDRPTMSSITCSMSIQYRDLPILETSKLAVNLLNGVKRESAKDDGGEASADDSSLTDTHEGKSKRVPIVARMKISNSTRAKY